MSRFKTSEEYYLARDTFCIYIEDEVNPARVAAGLQPIRNDEARECFRIIDEFMDKWTGRPSETVTEPRSAPK